VIWLLRHLKPDFKTIADFRRDNRNAFRHVFRQFVRLCQLSRLLIDKPAWMPLDFRYHSAGLLPALRLIAEAGVIVGKSEHDVAPENARCLGALRIRRAQRVGNERARSKRRGSFHIKRYVAVVFCDRWYSQSSIRASDTSERSFIRSSFLKSGCCRPQTSASRARSSFRSNCFS
jgi:hypothetical protein